MWVRWKKCFGQTKEGEWKEVVVRLRVPQRDELERANTNEREVSTVPWQKCRCKQAYVEEIFFLDETAPVDRWQEEAIPNKGARSFPVLSLGATRLGPAVETARSAFRADFVYRRKEWVVASAFSCDFEVCAPGIHYYRELCFAARQNLACQSLSFASWADPCPSSPAEYLGLSLRPTTPRPSRESLQNRAQVSLEGHAGLKVENSRGAVFWSTKVVSLRFKDEKGTDCLWRFCARDGTEWLDPIAGAIFDAKSQKQL